MTSEGCLQQSVCFVHFCFNILFPPLYSKRRKRTALQLEVHEGILRHIKFFIRSLEKKKKIKPAIRHDWVVKKKKKKKETAPLVAIKRVSSEPRFYNFP